TNAKANIKKLYPYAFLKKDLPTDLSIVGEGSYFSINSFSIFSLVNFSLPVELSSYFVSIMKSNNCNNSVRCSFLINLILNVYSDKLKTLFINNLLLSRSDNYLK